MMFKGTVLLLLLGVAGATAQTTKKTLLEAIKSNQDLSMLAHAIDKDESIVKYLTNFKGTVFAPTNKAFTDAVIEKLPYILKYHFVPGTALFSKDLTAGLKLTTADNGKELTVKRIDDQLYIDAANSEAKIIRKDINIGDEVAVHITDTVLLPSDGVAHISTYRPYNSVESAAQGEDLDLFLAALSYTELEDVLGVEFNGTVFAPSNDALAAFVKEQGIRLDALTGEQLASLYSILLYHVVPSVVVFSQDLPDGNTVLETLADVPLTVMNRHNGVHVMGADGKECAVTKANIKAGDAVVHVIDCMMPMSLAPPPKLVPPSSATTTLAGVAALAASLLAAALAM